METDLKLDVLDLPPFYIPIGETFPKNMWQFSVLEAMGTYKNQSLSIRPRIKN